MLDDDAPSLREHNRRRILRILESNVAISRSELSARTGLSRTTVTGIVSELIREGVARSAPPAPIASDQPLVGRPAELVSLTPKPGFALALDIAHESVRVAIVGLDGSIGEMRSARVPFTASADVVVARAADAARRLVTKSEKSLRDVSGVVAAVPEPIDRNGHVPRVDRMGRWSGRNPAAMLTEALGVPAVAENDANLAVIGERLYGGARGLDDVVYVKVGHGVGTGIVTNGTLVRGGGGLAGEVGHIQVRRDGMICTCGNRGCLFTLVSGHYLARLLDGSGGVGDAKPGIDDLTAMAVREHPGARRLLQDAGAEVGKVVASISNALNPTAVILGGRLAHAGDALLQGVREAMSRYAEPQVSADLRVAVTTLNENAELLGAAAVVAGIADLPGRKLTTSTGSRGAGARAPASAEH